MTSRGRSAARPLAQVRPDEAIGIDYRTEDLEADSNARLHERHELAVDAVELAADPCSPPSLDPAGHLHPGDYKSSQGYTFTDGDYFGIAVGSTGITHVIWGEADGSSLYCCSDVWYTKGS